MILEDGAHRAVALKDEEIYNTNKHILALLYVRKDGREMKDEVYLLLGSMQNSIDQKGCRMTMVDNVSMCNVFLTTILAADTHEKDSSSIKDLRASVTGAGLLKVMLEEQFTMMKPRQLLRYTSIVAAIHKFTVLEDFLLKSFSTSSYQLPVLEGNDMERSNHHEEALLIFKRVGAFSKAFPKASEKELK
eukprot:IDg2643t1